MRRHISGREATYMAIESDALSNVPVPIPGFGSTDCRRCRSHLLRWSDANMSISSLKLAMQRVSVGQGAANTND